MIGNSHSSGVSASRTPEFTKFLLPSGTSGGKCLDGSPAGFYYNAPTSPNSSLWVFFMQGGGACYTKESCTSRSKSNLGSSVKWPNTKIFSKGILSGDPVANPDFYDSHRVYIPYCSGDVHAGQRLAATKETWGFYFSGRINFMKILDFLLANSAIGPALKNAKQVMLSGGSAGGIGAFVNVDYLADTLSWSTVKGAPQCGWFFPGYTEDQPNHPDYPPSDWPHWSTGQTGRNTSSQTQLWDFFLNPECVQKFPGNESFVCGSVHNLYPFIKSPLFVMENQYDTNQLHAQLLLPKSKDSTPQGRAYIAYFGRSMRNSTERKLSLKPKDGLFLPSCFDHGGGLGVGGKTIISGINQTVLLGDWFFQRGKFKSHQIVDDCQMEEPGLPCNPTCNHVPRILMS